MSATEPRVVAVVATMHRPAEISAMLASLAALTRPVLAAIVVDNGASEETRRAVEGSSVRTVYHAVPGNLGCGGGLRVGEQLALERFGAEMTHLWILDDDVIVYPDTLQRLLDALAAADAEAACALVEDEAGRVTWFPGLLDRAKFQVVKTPRPVAEYVRLCGTEPVPFSWAQGISLLVTRRALDRVGLHRGDFWVRGEDLDFSLRVTHRHLGLWAPAARVRHLPPASAGAAALEYVRHAALLQNMAYVGLRLRHGRRIARTIPGALFRFVKAGGWKPRAFLEGARAVFYGAVLGWPAGLTYGRAYLTRS